jgi:hypothetical protein
MITSVATSQKKTTPPDTHQSKLEEKKTKPTFPTFLAKMALSLSLSLSLSTEIDNVHDHQSCRHRESDNFGFKLDFFYRKRRIIGLLFK